MTARDEQGDDSALPLAGMRVVELSTYVAAPLCGLNSAQLGADVIRVEPIGGAVDRSRWPLAASGASLYWSGLNQGKRAVEVDLTSPEGRELVADLAVQAGVVVTNSERYRELSYESLRSRRPDLIYLVLTGRYDGSAAVDYTVQAATGFPVITGPEDAREPVNHVLPAWDVAAGMLLTIGLLAAERRRARTGEGSRVTVALEDVALAVAGNLGFLAEAQLGNPRERYGNHIFGTFGRDFVTGDGNRLVVVVLTARHWRELVEIIGLGAVFDALEQSFDADFRREADRFRYREALAGVVAGWMSEQTRESVKQKLAGRSLLWSWYRSFAELVADDARSLRENPLLSRVEHPGVDGHWAPGSPLIFSGRRTAARPAPGVGEHTAEVLRHWLGLSGERLAGLAESRVIGTRNRAEGRM
ncbi:CoA transferase [Nocardia sp. NBC_00881]|uniref:CoA transferase n=1 Tax=Nocardia sp. NBC_00881 TaxID=2975995 RepID=UPI0038684FA4|nr:CoA transferase [Nocardia sp. NBC_00881]